MGCSLVMQAACGRAAMSTGRAAGGRAPGARRCEAAASCSRAAAAGEVKVRHGRGRARAGVLSLVASGAGVLSAVAPWAGPGATGAAWAGDGAGEGVGVVAEGVVRLKDGTGVDWESMAAPTLFVTARPAAVKVPLASLRREVAPGALAQGPGGGVSFVLGQGEVLFAESEFPQIRALLDGADVLVSARLDSDGDPNTRDASDLVGRGVATWDAREGTRGGAVVQLESRGAFGRLVTQRAAPPPRAS